MSALRNIKISVKLPVGFFVIALMALVIGIIGMFGLQSMKEADEALYEENLVSISIMGEIRENVQRQRVRARELIMFHEDAESCQNSYNDLKSLEQTMNDLFVRYEKTITDTALESDYYNAKKIYQTDYATIKENMRATGQQGYEEGAAYLRQPEVGTANNTMIDGFTKAMKNNEAWALESVNNNRALYSTLNTILMTVIICAVILSAILSVYLSRTISKPMRTMRAVMDEAGGTGDMHLSEAAQRDVEEEARYRDEVGLSILSFNKLMDHLRNTSSILELVASGDLTSQANLLSDRDTMGVSLKEMLENLNDMFEGIQMSATQVNEGARQIADGGQALAQGATQQASAIEELSASITEISQQSRANAANAQKANELANGVMETARTGGRQMEKMVEAVENISKASDSISKIIETIKDIAFQTNILALNASVAAARAGQAGRSFAVVAEQVKELSNKSSEAAAETNAMIVNSIELAKEGVEIAEQTASSLNEIVAGVEATASLVAEIASASGEQALAVDQINRGIDQVSLVVQNNSATAQESASASSEISSQVSALNEMVSHFQLRSASGRLGAGAKGRTQALPAGERQKAAPKQQRQGESGYGKY